MRRSRAEEATWGLRDATESLWWGMLQFEVLMVDQHFMLQEMTDCIRLEAKDG